MGDIWVPGVCDVSPLKAGPWHWEKVGDWRGDR